MKKVLIAILSVFILLIVFISVLVLMGLRDKEYKVGDTGVYLKVSTYYTSDIESKFLLSLHNSKKGIDIETLSFEYDFWKSGDNIDAICDEYMRYNSASMYDRDISDVSLDKITIDDEEIGKVEFTASQKNSSRTTTTLLFPKKYKSLIIEISGSSEAVKENKKEIEKIISNVSIK